MEGDRYRDMYGKVQENMKKEDEDGLKKKMGEQNRYKEILDFQVNLKVKPKEDERDLTGQWQAQ